MRRPRPLSTRTAWPRSLAGQAIALQILVIAVVVLAGSALALFDARRDGDAAAASRSLGIATALADSPSTAAAIESGRATEILQPVTEAVRTNTDIAFITIMAPDRTRFTHTDPAQIGGHYLGTIEPALRGETFTEVYTGTLGPSIRAVAPVRDGSRPDRRRWSRRASCSRAWPTAGARSGRRSPRSALRRWLFRWSGCGRSGDGCCARPTGCAPTNCG